jgi:hypothetical protein
MDICLTVLTDGRKQYIERAIPSWMKQYDSLISNKFIIDDSGQKDYRAWLKDYFPSFTIIPVGASRCGYSLAMSKVFSTIVESKTKYVLHLEDDFILNKPVSLENMISVLDKKPLVSQMSIMRQPWFANEKECGGVVEALEQQGIFFEALKEEIGKDFDPFDLICHVAFDQPPLTRKERANNVKKRNYFTKYGEQARKVLETLLDKYADEGVENIESIEVLRVKPFDEYGSPIEIISHFGDKQHYMDAVKELETELYKQA